MVNGLGSKAGLSQIDDDIPFGHSANFMVPSVRWVGYTTITHMETQTLAQAAAVFHKTHGS